MKTTDARVDQTKPTPTTIERAMRLWVKICGRANTTKHRRTSRRAAHEGDDDDARRARRQPTTHARRARGKARCGGAGMFAFRRRRLSSAPTTATTPRALGEAKR